MIISLGILVYRVSFPQISELGRDTATQAFESRAFHADAEQIPGVVVYRFESPLIYANADAFANGARDLVDAADPPARVLVVDCEVMFGIDYTGTKALTGLIDDMRDRDVEVRLARVHAPALEKLRTSGVLEKLGEDNVFVRVEQAAKTAPSTGNGKLRPTSAAPTTTRS